MASLANPRAKFRRAVEHRDTLDAEVNRFRRRQPYSIAHEQHPEGWHLFLLEVREEPPLELGVILGDWLHNLRSALDNLAWQLVLLNGERPTKKTEFPIFANPRKFALGGPVGMRGMNADHQAFIERLQPYPRRRGPRHRHLETVYDLSKIDKHRTINSAYAFPLAQDPPTTLTFRSAGLTAEAKLERFPLRVLKHGAEVARIQLHAEATYETQVDMNPELPIDIAFGDGVLRRGDLTEVEAAIEAIIEEFAPEFPPEPGGYIPR